jgi:hypothetical protein
MADITMCDDNRCPLRSNCYRFQAVPNMLRQSYFSNTPRTGHQWYSAACDEYIEMDDDWVKQVDVIKEDSDRRHNR